jgi:hypothetical protein
VRVRVVFQPNTRTAVDRLTFFEKDHASGFEGGANGGRGLRGEEFIYPDRSKGLPQLRDCGGPNLPFCLLWDCMRDSRMIISKP